MFGPGGESGIGAGFEYFLQFFGQENSLSLIKYPFLEIIKLQFGSKFVGKIPREWKGDVFKCRTYARISSLCPNINSFGAYESTC